MADQADMRRDPESEYWNSYFDAVAAMPMRDTFLRAVRAFANEVGNDEDRPSSTAPRPLAIDLGCGDGKETVELLRRGWRVLAIDSSEEGLTRLRARVEAAAVLAGNEKDLLKTIVATFEGVALPPSDFVNASFSIPHCSSDDFPAVWAKIVRSLRPGGRFAGQFFGVNDGWATRKDGIARTYHTRPQVEAMLAPFDIEFLDEVEQQGKTAMGEPKYWHVFHVVARKK